MRTDRIGPILNACLRIVTQHYRALLRPTLVLSGMVFAMAVLIAVALGGALLSGAEFFRSPGLWPFMSAVFFLARMCVAPFEVWWLKNLQATLDPTQTVTRSTPGQVFEAVLLEAVRAPVVITGFLMCVLPGLMLRPLLFLPESALAQGYSLRESVTMALALMRERFSEIVLTDFVVVMACGALQFIPLVGPFLILPALLLGRYVTWLDFSGRAPAEELAPAQPQALA